MRHLCEPLLAWTSEGSDREEEEMNNEPPPVTTSKLFIGSEERTTATGWLHPNPLLEVKKGRLPVTPLKPFIESEERATTGDHIKTLYCKWRLAKTLYCKWKLGEHPEGKTRYWKRSKSDCPVSTTRAWKLFWHISFYSAQQKSLHAALLDFLYNSLYQ